MKMHIYLALLTVAGAALAASVVNGPFILIVDAPPAGSAGEKRIAVYSGAIAYSVPVVDRDGREYVGLFEILVLFDDNWGGEIWSCEFKL